ncbi:MAG: MBOAT family protein [Bacteroidetes bacterium]|nr:MBOAT family protein [Bacteroidota bacterium]
MLFNSIEFGIFLPVVFLLYWALRRSRRLQNAFLFTASAFFYAWWDWRYLGLVFFSAGIDYVVAIALERTEAKARRKALLAVSLVTNLGLLGFFKYYDFFVTNFNEAFTLLGRPLGLSTLHLVLPVGISFYTFQSLSYTIDVYRRQMRACRHPLDYFPFILFFPQLMAGPIERAYHLLPQFQAPRVFNEAQARDGLRQILWGLFKKVVVADNCAYFVDMVYGDPSGHTGSAAVLATLLFTFQIYSDFSGYSDIALGSARLLGFDLVRNFAFPLFARDVGEYWRRWHISLNTWFRDYLYIPLGGSRGGRWLVARNTMAIFLVSGFWHGANWTFVIWGAINGLYFLPSILRRRHRRFLDVIAQDRVLPTFFELRHLVVTFVMIAFTRVFFRSPDLHTAWTMLERMFSASLFAPLGLPYTGYLYECLALAGGMFAVEYVQRRKQHGLQLEAGTPRALRWAIYLFVVAVIVAYAPMGGAEFIYFQF